jgi:hypothetical protein
VSDQPFQGCGAPDAAHREAGAFAQPGRGAAVLGEDDHPVPLVEGAHRLEPLLDLVGVDGRLGEEHSNSLT